MERENLLKSKEYWLTTIQLKLFTAVEDYLIEKDINRTQFSKEIGVSKGYISQILNGDFDHRISKFVELSLAIGKVPIIELKDINSIIEIDKNFYDQYITVGGITFLNNNGITINTNFINQPINEIPQFDFEELDYDDYTPQPIEIAA